MNQTWLDDLLPRITKPSRYIGGEWNTITKDAAAVKLRVCLCFPDLYELGLGNLGLQILYAILNRMEGVWAERAYMPAPDMEDLLRENARPLFMLESKAPLTDAHAIGFTLQSELTYVNILKMLELAGLPWRSDARDEDAPLVFAGGPGAYNPEPLAPFMDFFAIGDGEEVIIEIADCLMRHQDASRRKRLEALAAIKGVYVPALYPVEHLADGRVLPRADQSKIQARFVENLDAAPFPERYITPFMQMVHDGVGLEVLRGCTHGCRFCQAGMVTRPVRERGVETIQRLLENALTSAGMEDATLLSLSTCDYSQARELLRRVSEQARERHVAVALPSLRLDGFAIELADFITPLRRSGLTFAPEAGTNRLRAVINKNVTDDQLIQLAEEAFSRGWTHIKAYFMIGLPTETDADVDAIADCCTRVIEAGRCVRRGAMLRTGVSTFVPKPFTPFQWAAQIGLEETRRKQQRLGQLLSSCRAVKFGRHAPEASFIEGLLSRADRRAASLLEAVARNGGGHESWEERLNFDAWRVAIEETGYDVEAQFAERPLDMRLPWDHVETRVSRDGLREELLRSQEARTTPDCREGACNQCGATAHTPTACAEMRARAAAGRAMDVPVALEPVAQPLREGVQRIRFRVGREGALRFLSHLETAQAWIRALRRANAPLAYSQGYHAHPKVSFAAALPVGEESEAELMDVVLHTFEEADDLLARLRPVLPEGLCAYEARSVPLRAPALMAEQIGLVYVINSDCTWEEAAPRAAALEQQTQWLVDRSVKSGTGRSGKGSARKTIRLDIRPLIVAFDAGPNDEGGTCIRFATKIRDGRIAKALELLRLLDLDPLRTRIRKIETRLRS